MPKKAVSKDELKKVSGGAAIKEKVDSFDPLGQKSFSSGEFEGENVIHPLGEKKKGSFREWLKHFYKIFI